MGETMNMTTPSPSRQEWKDLYEAAITFQAQGSWNWMGDSDVFGVQDPISAQVGYCCIMGRLGEFFGLAVYLGTEGLEGYLKLQSGKGPSTDIEALMLQNCLMASFEDRNMLQKPDLQVIKQLDLKFRGHHAWPLFRSYRPGYHPWYLTKSEAIYLTVVLHQAVGVARRFKENSKMLTPPKKNQYLVRVPEKEGTGWRWRDEWLTPAAIEKRPMTVGPIDEVCVQRIKKARPPQQGVWEVDFFYSPTGVVEGERPYYPYMVFYVDHHSGFILNADIVRPWELTLEFPEKFLTLVDKAGWLPKEVLVRREEAFTLLEPITSRLGIKLTSARRLNAIEQARAAMFASFPFMGRP